MTHKGQRVVKPQHNQSVDGDALLSHLVPTAYIHGDIRKMLICLVEKESAISSYVQCERVMHLVLFLLTDLKALFHKKPPYESVY